MAATIRRARPGDAPVVAGFNIALARETEEVTLDPAVIGPGVAAILADPSKGLYFVAEEDGRVVGQTMVTFEWSDWRNGNLWWIQSVYVEERARGAGVFRSLYAEVKKEARKAGARGIRLYVFDGNKRAQEVYARLGMEDGHYRVMEEIF
jgi:GNAT superfamily N-acetyltransferase